MSKDKRDQWRPPDDNKRNAFETGNAGFWVEPPFSIQLSILSAGDHWTIEFQCSDDRDDFPVPLPTTVILNFAKTHAPVSPVELDHLAPRSWMAWAFRSNLSLTMSLVEFSSTPVPIQFQVVLHHMNEHLALILSRIDWNGHRYTTWSSILKRE